MIDGWLLWLSLLVGTLASASAYLLIGYLGLPVAPAGVRDNPAAPGASSEAPAFCPLRSCPCRTVSPR